MSYLFVKMVDKNDNKRYTAHQQLKKEKEFIYG